MSWLDKLKQLVNIKIGSIIQINITNTNHSNNNTQTKVSPYHLDEESKILHINTNGLTPAERKTLKASVVDYIEEGHRLFEFKTNDLFEELYNFKKKTSLILPY